MLKLTKNFSKAVGSVSKLIPTTPKINHPQGVSIPHDPLNDARLEVERLFEGLVAIHDALQWFSVTLMNLSCKHDYIIKVVDATAFEKTLNEELQPYCTAVAELKEKCEANLSVVKEMVEAVRRTVVELSEFTRRFEARRRLFQTAVDAQIRMKRASNERIKYPENSPQWISIGKDVERWQKKADSTKIKFKAENTILKDHVEEALERARPLYSEVLGTFLESQMVIYADMARDFEVLRSPALQLKRRADAEAEVLKKKADIQVETPSLVLHPADETKETIRKSNSWSRGASNLTKIIMLTARSVNSSLTSPSTRAELARLSSKDSSESSHEASLTRESTLKEVTHTGSGPEDITPGETPSGGTTPRESSPRVLEVSAPRLTDHHGDGELHRGGSHHGEERKAEKKTAVKVPIPTLFPTAFPRSPVVSPPGSGASDETPKSAAADNIEGGISPSQQSRPESGTETQT